MVTNYPHVLVAAQSRMKAGWWAAGVRQLFRRIGQMLCGFRGHDLVRHYERDRVALQCTSCGHVSPGWHIGGATPQLRYAGDPRRHQLRQVRRVA
ncbi:MAG TPA: hypothetical protein VIL35_15370 [Vicinamibacterales bacterium]